MSDTATGTSHDSLGSLAWGLRRYWWVLVLSTVLLGVVVPALVARLPADRYEASAQVGPVGELNIQNMDSLPRTGQTVFENGAVSEAVRESFHPALPPDKPVIPGRVALVAPQDNLVFTVVGRSDDPAQAQDLANLAAGAFATELNKYAVAMGQFAVQHPAAVPPRPAPTLRPLPAAGLGAVAGLLVGLGVIILVMAWRRPVVDAASASGVTGVPVLGRVRISSAGDVLGGIAPLCHRLLEGGATTALLVGPTPLDRQALAAQVRALLAESARKARGPQPPGKPKDPRVPQERVTIVENPSEATLAVRPPSSIVVLVVPIGTPQSVVRREAEPLVDPESSAVVLVARTRPPRQHRVRHAFARLRPGHRVARDQRGKQRGRGDRAPLTDRP